MSRNRTAKRLAVVLAIYLAILWGAGSIAYRTGLAYAADNTGAAPQASAPSALASNAGKYVKTAATCGATCNAPAQKRNSARQKRRIAVGPGSALLGDDVLTRDTPLSIAMALTTDTFDLSGGVFGADSSKGRFNASSIPGFVLGGIPSGGGGGSLPPLNPVPFGPPPSPPAGGPGDNGSGAGPNPPPGGGSPTINLDPPGGGTGGTPDVLETPIPGAIYLFGSAIAGFAFARRKAKG